MHVLSVATDASAEVLEEPALDLRLETRISAHLVGALGESGLEFGGDGGVGGLRDRRLLALHVHLVILQILDGHFEDVGLFEFRVASRLEGERATVD